MQISQKDLIKKFLHRKYPTQRIKDHKNKFKRTIVLDTGEYFYLSEKQFRIDLFYKLMENLSIIFVTDENTNREILKDFLRIK